MINTCVRRSVRYRDGILVYGVHPRGASHEIRNFSRNLSPLEYIRGSPKMNPFRLGFFVYKLLAIFAALATSPNSNQVICPNRSLALSLVLSRKP